VEWIGRLKENDPGNSLGYLFAAKSVLDGGNLDEALGELAALESTRLNDYSESWKSGFAAAYQSAGYQGLEAEWLCWAQVPILTGEVSRSSAGIGAAMLPGFTGGHRRSFVKGDGGAFADDYLSSELMVLKAMPARMPAAEQTTR
jgi:hypothetical protein